VNVAVDINRGRDLLLIPFRSPRGAPPSVDPDFSLSTASWGRLEDPEGYYETIPDILRGHPVYARWNDRRSASGASTAGLEGSDRDEAGHRDGAGRCQWAGLACFDAVPVVWAGQS
jgi:hypothetical protein